jgi:hypothetical protein
MYCDVCTLLGTAPTEEAVLKELSYNNRAVFSYLPDNIKQQLLLDRDPHGNVQVIPLHKLTNNNNIFWFLILMCFEGG